MTGDFVGVEIKEILYLLHKSTVMKNILFGLIVSGVLFSSKSADKNTSGGNMPVSTYFNYGDSGVQSAGIKMIPIKTPVGDFKVWTKRFGNNPRIKVLFF